MNTIQIPTYVFIAVCAAIVLLAAALVCLILRRKEKTAENKVNDIFDPECLFSKLKISNSTHNEEEKKDKEK